MDAEHPFLKRPSEEVPAVRVARAVAGQGAPPARRGRRVLAALGLVAIGGLAIATYSAHSLPPVPLTGLPVPTVAPPSVIPAPRLAISLPKLATPGRTDALPPPGDTIVVTAPRERATPTRRHPPTSATPPDAGPDAAPSSRTFADQVVLYRPAPAAARQAPVTAAVATPKGYRVVSIVAADLALIAMEVNGQTMVSPYRTGQSLPDGRAITAIDAAGHRIITNDGVLRAP